MTGDCSGPSPLLLFQWHSSAAGFNFPFSGSAFWSDAFYCSLRSGFSSRQSSVTTSSTIVGPPPIAFALMLGAAIGLLSGLTGVGGGIFLSPLLVLTGWATVRQSAAPTAAFVLINSISGLLGLLSRQPTLPDALPYWVAAVIVGGLIGATYGSRRLGNNAMRQALAVVLVIAGAKMIL